MVPRDRKHPQTRGQKMKAKCCCCEKNLKLNQLILYSITKLDFEVSKNKKKTGFCMPNRFNVAQIMCINFSTLFQLQPQDYNKNVKKK